MQPILFEIFGFPIYTYGFMLALAFLIAIIGINRRVKSRGIVIENLVLDLATWILVGAIVGARLVYILCEYNYYLNASWWEVFRIDQGGLAFHGGLIGGFIAGYWFLKRKRVNPWEMADIVAPFIAIGYGIVRIGCFLNGCCYGKETTLPWGVVFPKLDACLRHPTQIYSFVGSMLIAVILLWGFPKRQFPGHLFLLYVGYYSIMRFIVELFREYHPVFWGLSLAHYACLAMGLLAFSIILVVKSRYQKRKASVDAKTNTTSESGKSGTTPG